MHYYSHISKNQHFLIKSPTFVLANSQTMPKENLQKLLFNELKFHTPCLPFLDPNNINKLEI
jgi:ssDNA-specific exonuclease RecJ